MIGILGVSLDWKLPGPDPDLELEEGGILELEIINLHLPNRRLYQEA